MNLTHVDDNNRAKMVDVCCKDDSFRVAVASGKIEMSQEAFEAVVKNNIKKGPVLQCAVVAAIMAAKKSSELIPMCHPLMIGGVDCDIEQLDDLPGFKVVVSVKVDGKTGVEMEALTATSIALLTIYDMTKAIDKSMRISDIQLESKTGGKSGQYRRN